MQNVTYSFFQMIIFVSLHETSLKTHKNEFKKQINLMNTYIFNNVQEPFELFHSKINQLNWH